MNAIRGSSSAWDIGLSQNIAGVVQARSSQYGDEEWGNVLRALRNFRYFVSRSTSRREASPTLESILATVLSPTLQQVYEEEGTFNVTEELLAVMVALGRGRADIIVMMGEQGIFHVLTMMLMYNPTSEVTAGCLARLAGTCDPAGREAQIAILASGMALTYQPSSSSAPESSATAAARSQQVTPLNASPLPVVYKLLTADIKAGQDVAIQMLTFLCQMGAEWQTQEQLALAKFGNGVILSNLVERLGAVCNQTKLSGAKAAELASLLQLLSSATAGCERAQSKAGSAGILQHLVALLTPCNQQVKLSIVALGRTRVRARIHPHFKLPRRQVMEVLIAISNLVSQHTANRAILASLATPLTQALASFLCTLPCNSSSPSSDMATAHLPSQTQSPAAKNDSIEKPSISPAAHAAADDSALSKQRVMMSALTKQLRSPSRPSVLTAQLKGHMPGTSSHSDQQNTKPAEASAAAVAHISQGSTPPQHPQSGLKPPANSALRLEPGQMPEAEPEISCGSSSPQRSESAESEGVHDDDLEVQLARRFTFHVLLHLPAASLKPRQATWMEHAVGLPELMQCCVEVAVEQAPRAVGALWHMVQSWVYDPNDSSALCWLTHFPAVVQGLVQAVLGVAAAGAIQTLSVLSQQAPGAGALLGSAGAAEAIVAAALSQADLDLFDSPKDWSNLVVRVLPDVDAAISVLCTSQTAILESSSTIIRHRAISIMRAMSTLLDAASPQLAEEALRHAQQDQRVAAGVNPADVADPDTGPTFHSSKQAAGAEKGAKEVAQSPHEPFATAKSESDAVQFNMERAFAKGFLISKQPASAAQTGQQCTATSDLLPKQQQHAAAALPAANNNSTQAASDAVDEAGTELTVSAEKEEEEALAAARRQQTVDNLVDRLFEESINGGSSRQSGSDNATSDHILGSDASDLVFVTTQDSGLLSGSSAGKSISASLPSVQGSDSSVTDSASEQQADYNPEEEEVSAETEEEEKFRKDDIRADLQKVLTSLELQGRPGLGRALQQVLQAPEDPSPDPIPNPTAPSSALKGKGRAGATPRQAFVVPGIDPRAAAGVTAGSGAKQAIKPTAQPSAAPKRVANPGEKQSKGLLPLMPPRGSKKSRTGGEEPALVPGQQAAGLPGRMLGSSDPKGGFSPDQLQAMINLVFKAGFEHMGQLANASTETAAGLNVESDTAAAASPQALIDDNEQDTSHNELQHAFNQVVERGLQKQEQSGRQQSECSAPAQGNATGIAYPAAALRTKTASIPSQTAPVPDAAATSSAAAITAAASHATATAGSALNQQEDMDIVPRHLVAREKVRVARVLAEDQLPRFHSVYSRYGCDQHVNEIHELTACHRQIGFKASGTSVRRKPLRQSVAVKALFGAASIAFAAAITTIKSRSHCFGVDGGHNIADIDGSSDSDFDF